MQTAGEDFVVTVMPAVDLVHNLARRLVRRPGDAEDLAQDTLARAWESWTRGTRPDSVPAWLSTICLNLARDRGRRAARDREVAWGEGLDPPGSTDVAGEAIARVQRAQVEAALWSLPEAQRIAIVLMDICGLSAAEVGAVIDAPRGTVLARVHRGRKALAAEVVRRQGERPSPPGRPAPGTDPFAGRPSSKPPHIRSPEPREEDPDG